MHRKEKGMSCAVSFYGCVKKKSVGVLKEFFICHTLHTHTHTHTHCKKTESKDIKKK